MDPSAMATRSIATSASYNEDVVRAFVVATMFWGLAAFTVGVFIAFQLTYPVLNLDLEWTTFGRLRPLHTSAAIFAFGGNALLGTSFHVVQRTCRARLFGGKILVGAGTVLEPREVDEVAAAGAKLVVAPNFDPAVIERAVKLGLAAMPGGWAAACEKFLKNSPPSICDMRWSMSI